MKQDSDKVFEATLLSDGQDVAVRLFRGSKYSILVDFPEKNQFQDGTIFDALCIPLNEEKFQLPHCVFILDRGLNHQHSGSLIFPDNLHDFDYLFFNERLVDLHTMSNDRDLLRQQKDEIRQSFKTYTSNLTFDIELFLLFFTELDRQIDKEPEYVRSSAIATLLKTEGQKFISFLKDQQKELEREIAGFTRSEHISHGYYFRTQIRHIIDQSAILKRTNDKPRGYIGDSDMMRMIYAGGYVGESSFSKILYKYSIDHEAAQAVRNRRKMISGQLKEISLQNKKKGGGQLRILSVACGPFCELEDFFRESTDLVDSEFVLLDQDELAIQHAGETIQNVEKKIGMRLTVTFIQDSIRTVIRNKNLAETIGHFDFIYSMGMFDYLTALVGRRIMQKLFSLLKPGGKILVGNYHYQNPSRLYMEYWHDWVLYYRDQQEFKQLLNGLDAEDVTVTFEDSKSQMFLTARKGG